MECRYPDVLRPSGKLYRGATQTNLVDGDITLVELDTIASDFTDGIEDTTNHKITPGYAGFYLVMGTVTFKSLIADRKYDAAIKLNGSTWICFIYGWASGEDYFVVPVLAYVRLTATDYIELYARSCAGVDTVDIHYGPIYTFLSVQRVR